MVLLCMLVFKAFVMMLLSFGLLTPLLHFALLQTAKARRHRHGVRGPPHAAMLLALALSLRARISVLPSRSLRVTNGARHRLALTTVMTRTHHVHAKTLPVSTSQPMLQSLAAWAVVKARPVIPTTSTFAALVCLGEPLLTFILFGWQWVRDCGFRLGLMPYDSQPTFLSFYDRLPFSRHDTRRVEFMVHHLRLWCPISH